MSHRGNKNKVDVFKPNGYFIEKECVAPGVAEDITTILLVNNECPFRCLMCDFWKNTTNNPVPEEAIVTQIKYALSRLPATKHLKLYNSGSFFDNNAIPKNDYEKIAKLIENFETVTVESHPRFINNDTALFSKMLKPELRVALGLETIHPEILPKLNKKMKLSDFEQSVNFLSSHKIKSRAFILLRPPVLSEDKSILWAKKSIDYAFNIGVTSCVIIPVRAGNGALEELAANNYFTQPDIKSLEKVVEYGIGVNAGLVFADLWDIDRFSSCDKCFDSRKTRLHNMNLYQKIHTPVNCACSF